MDIRFQTRTFIRKGSAGLFGHAGLSTYCNLANTQPLLLHREPENPAHAGAVLVTDLLGVPCGYLAREHAGSISNLLQRGLLLMARCDGPCQCIHRKVLVWYEGGIETKELERTYGKRQVQTIPVKKPERA